MLRVLYPTTRQDEDDMVRMLRARELDAIILDKQFVDYRVATSCDLYAVGDLLRPYSTGFVFPPDTALVRHTRAARAPALRSCAPT